MGLNQEEHEFVNRNMRLIARGYACRVCGLEVKSHGRHRTGNAWGSVARHIIAKHYKEIIAK